ncbi:MAG: FHA domain-containing protein [Planctomycetes bacterium]|nr:FHA domain-containing protein [Planctomycetota bacterium]
MATLSVRSDGGEESFPLEAPSVTLGRGLECDIRLKDIKSSRRHCQVVRAADGYKLVDLGSGNGTFVNGVLVEREQKLRSGDSIQVGESVIVFSEADGTARPTPTRRPATEADKKQASSITSRTPAVPSPTARTVPKPATAQTALTKKMTPSGANATSRKTDRLPAAPPAPARPTTSRVPTSGGGATTRRGATTPPAPPPGAPTRRGGTSRVPTASGPADKKRTTRATMVDKFTAQAGKKKTNPLIFVIAGAGVALAVITILIVLFAGKGDDLEFDRNRIKEITGEAAKAVDRDEFDKAVGLYQDAIKLCERHKDKLSQQKEQLKKEIEQVNGYKKDRENASSEWESVKKEFNDNKYSEKEDGIRDFMNRVKRVRDNHRELKRPWALPQGTSEIDKMYEKLENQYNTEMQIRKAEGYNFKRNEINRKFLSQDGKEDYGGAIQAWTEYIGTTRDAEGKRKGPEEILKICRDAYGAWERLSRKTANMEKAEALERLREHQPRFKGCKFEKDGVLHDIEKEIADRIAELEK